MKADRLNILNCGNYYTVVNLSGDEENHTHVRRHSTAELLVKLIMRQEVPKSKYLRSSALRVSVNEKYKEKIRIKQEKDKQRQYYFNPNKGVRRQGR